MPGLTSGRCRATGAVVTWPTARHRPNRYRITMIPRSILAPLGAATILGSCWTARLDAQLGHPAFVIGGGVVHPVRQLRLSDRSADLATAPGLQLGLHLPVSGNRIGGQIDGTLVFKTPLTVYPPGCGGTECSRGSRSDYRLAFVSTSFWVRPTERSPFRLIAGTGFAARTAKPIDCTCGIEVPGMPPPFSAGERTAGAVRLAVAWAPKRTGAFEVVVSNTMARTENRRTQHYLTGTFNYHLRLTRQE